MSYTNDKIQAVADRIIKQMEEHGTNWIKPFTYGSKLNNNETNGLPKNIRGTYYSGINTFILGMAQSDSNYSSSYWMTFKQCQTLGGKIKKGQKATSVTLWKLNTIKDPSNGEVKDIPLLAFYNVFNLNQTTLTVDDLPKPRVKPLVNLIDEVETFVKNTKAEIVHKESGRCYYVPSMDFINMSPLDTWKNLENNTKEQLYYSTLLHELVHWTGNEKRLDRLKSSFKGDDVYAFEELVAETGSAILCTILGIQKEPSDQHAKYLNGWMKKIKDDPKAIFKAIAMSQKAINFLQDLQQPQVKVNDDSTGIKVA